MKRLALRLFMSLRLPMILALLAWAPASAATAATLSGTVKSGAAVIRGATVTLYSAGYDRGVAPNVLASAVTNAKGQFDLRYPQPGADSVLYVTARGPAPTADLAAMLGPKQNTGGAVRNIVVNELSTIASAWAMAQFMSGDNIGGKSPGLQNAAATAGNMVDVNQGTIAKVLATPPNGSQTTTLAEFNSLANLISACADTPANCSLLFSLSTPPGGATPARAPSNSRLTSAPAVWRGGRNGQNPQSIHRTSKFCQPALEQWYASDDCYILSRRKPYACSPSGRAGSR